MKEAEYYHPTADGVVCDLCPHRCHIREGQRGICRSRLCRDGKLYSEVYGRPCALAIDPIEKKPLRAFHPGSRCLSLACTGCNFRCLNCQNHDISQARPGEVYTAEYAPADIVAMARRELPADRYQPAPIIAYTYTEPLTYIEYVRDTASLAHRQGMLNVLVSAGYVEPRPLADLAPWLDAANIDLKAFSDDIYRRVCGGSLQPVLNTLLQLQAAGVWVEITNLMIPTVNDDMELFGRMCQWLVANGFGANPLHISRFFPHHKLQHLRPTPLDTLRQARDIAAREGISHIYLGNV
ncbi:AmmeMemoRadiSam system radical SAM enzyme [Prevotella sp. kh1p2]|uniref:AmmeMemoRadiSam system radical SAM enzyme n=1 Tax=Prevotella sp. kh1p2 TaxID=1761883 RepID=UPI0008C9E62D|nr:AmmeMemoRadiSam system radical SAM enzyme [Prevotella sp. kh1p2]SET21584.1 pyruvate formate lyase activating enzyme [Prevotella sp. kh1p2]SNU12338.1 pyruvate formate lyase activating enzyme [Prevotellaceae bacterium KH2P17]